MKVATVEVNRDGVFDRNLGSDTFGDETSHSLNIHVSDVSDDKSGKKRLVTRIILYDGKLHVLIVPIWRMIVQIRL